MGGDIPLLFEVGLEQRFHYSCLCTLSLGPRQLDQPMRIPRAPCLSTEPEVNSYFFPYTCQALEHHFGSLLSEACFVKGELVDPSFGSVRVEVKREPSDGECITLPRRAGLVVRDGPVEPILANVAPGADGVRDDGDDKFGHLDGRAA